MVYRIIALALLLAAATTIVEWAFLASKNFKAELHNNIYVMTLVAELQHNS
jgi:hypothetical protein